MDPTGALRRLLGIRPYTTTVTRFPPALRRQPTRVGERGRQNGQYAPYAPPGLTFEEESALADLERDQRCIRARVTDLARWRQG
jgi:hypothetical protein